MTLQQHQLSNGLTIIGEPKASAQSMAAGFFVRTGARDESSEVAGVSHFLEHMMFKGTSRRTYEDINREFDEMGAQYNAFTTEENTVYYGAVLPEFQPRLLDLLCDMMRPTLRSEDFDTEKKVILEEIAMYQDRPQHIVFDALRELHFGGHPMGNSVLGSTRSIGALERQQMERYFSSRYSPNNLTLTLVGRYEWDAALPQVEEMCGNWTPAEAPRALDTAHHRSVTQILYDEKLNRAHIAFACPGVSAQDPRRYAADVLADVLGGPRGSRMYWALVEPGIADVAQVFHDEGDGAGWFGGYLSCDPSRAEEVRSRFLEVLQDALSCNVTAEEVARVTRKGAAGQVIRGETPMGRLTNVGFDWVYRKEVSSVDEEADALLAVDAGACNELLDLKPFNTLTTVALGPLRASLQAAAPAAGDGLATTE